MTEQEAREIIGKGRVVWVPDVQLDAAISATAIYDVEQRRLACLCDAADGVSRPYYRPAEEVFFTKSECLEYLRNKRAQELEGLKNKLADAQMTKAGTEAALEKINAEIEACKLPPLKLARYVLGHPIRSEFDQFNIELLEPLQINHFDEQTREMVTKQTTTIAIKTNPNGLCEIITPYRDAPRLVFTASCHESALNKIGYTLQPGGAK